MGYHASIDGQMSAAQKLLEEQHAHQLQYMAATIEQQKKDFNIQKDQEKAAQAAALQQQYTAQLHQLQDAARQQRVQLEAQAVQLHHEHAMRTAQAALRNEAYASEKRHYDAQV